MLKRVRGFLLRLVLKRRAAIVLGLLLIAPSVWLRAEDFSWESALTDGLGLVVGATGVALLFAGIGGRRPDWIE